MANLGFQTLYRLLNGQEDALCERFFSGSGRSADSGRAAAAFDVIALSLSFEGDYTNAAAFLDDAGLEVRSERRGERHPLVVAGGMAPSLNPEPLAHIADVIYLGEAETGLLPLHSFLAERWGTPRLELLKALAAEGLPGVYVPAAYEVEETDEGAVRHPRWDAPATVELQKASPGWEPAHTVLPAPGDAFGGAYLLEVSRGCARACRFCASGHLLGRPRFIPFELLAPYITEGAALTGRVGFVGAAVSDHPGFKDLARFALDAGAGFTVSSFRAESVDREALELMKRGGLKTLTIALEAGGELLRRRIGKKLTREDVLAAASLAREAGIKKLRVYGMIGLPGETAEDVAGLARLAVEIKKAHGPGEVTLSVSSFVPKPFTPFQREEMAPERVLTERLRELARTASPHGVKVTGESPKWAGVQGFFARGGRRAGELLAQNPPKARWSVLLREEWVDGTIHRGRSASEKLPWEFITGTPDAGALAASLSDARSCDFQRKEGG